MRKGIFCFLIGIICFQFMPTQPGLLWLAIFPVLVLVMGWQPGVRWPGFVVLGFLWALWRADLVLSSPSVSEDLRQQDLVTLGWVASLPDQGNGRVRFLFRPAVLLHNDIPIEPPPLIRLSWYNIPDKSLQPGQWLALSVRLKPPGGYLNPGGFDYEGWLFQRGIRATGYVRHPLSEFAQQKLLNRYPDIAKLWSTVPWRAWPDRIRNLLQQSLQFTGGRQPENLGLVHALAIGERGGIEDYQWDILRKTGTSHLLAISGLHIGLVAGFGFFFLGRFWGWCGRCAQYFPVPKVAALGGLFFALSYSLLAGFEIPTQRALVMAAVVMGLLILPGRLLASQIFSLALLAVLLLDPLSVLAPGFWLSFAAVATILYTAAGRLRGGKRCWQWLRVHWVVAVALTPFLLFSFQRTSLIAPLANILAVPWVSFVSVPLVLSSTILGQVSDVLGQWLLTLAVASLDLLWWFLTLLASLPLAEWNAPNAGPGYLVAAVGGVFWLLAPRGWPARWLGLLTLLPVAFIKPPAPAAGAVDVTLLDVGQGLSVVVRTAQHVLVYDTGPRFGPGFDAGEAVIIPYLRHYGVQRLDRVIISHGDSDHVGGASSLLRALPVTQVLKGADVPALEIPADSCYEARQWRWDGVEFRLFSPREEGMAGGKENDGSCVLRIAVPGVGSVLLPGDVEAQGERILAERYGGELASTLLVAPHHGSKTSSTQIFLDQVKPRYVLFSTGRGNRFHFPNETVVGVYRHRGVTAMDTAWAGAIDFHMSPERGVIGPRSYRDIHRRYWLNRQ